MRGHLTSKGHFCVLACTNKDGEPDHILLIEVLQSNELHANQADDVFFRVGDKSKKLNFDERLQLMYAKSTRYFEDTPVPDAAMEDIDLDFVREYTQKLGYRKILRKFLWENKEFISTKGGKEEVSTAQESTLVAKKMLPSFSEEWGMATFLDLYRNNEPAYTELINKYIVHKIIEDAGMTPQHEYFRIDTVGQITRYQEMSEAAHKLNLSAQLWDLEIAVENENSRKDWTDEVIKLIHVKCPLKVVISYSRCDERDTTERKKLDFTARWMQEVKAFAKGSDEEYLLIFGNCFNSKTKADYDTFDYRGYLYNRQTRRFDRI